MIDSLKKNDARHEVCSNCEKLQAPMLEIQTCQDAGGWNIGDTIYLCLPCIANALTEDLP